MTAHGFFMRHAEAALVLLKNGDLTNAGNLASHIVGICATGID
jgi:hypothetical protein